MDSARSEPPPFPVTKEYLNKIRRIAYLEGQIKGIEDYAVWNNGTQYVGAMRRPLKEVLEPLHREASGLLIEIIAMWEAA